VDAQLISVLNEMIGQMNSVIPQLADLSHKRVQ
jgi:hypothetical protein